MRKGLIVFAREPLPGRVKTRLAAAVGEQLAARLYENMLQDVLHATRQLRDIETVVFWACPEESLPKLAEQYRCNSRCQSEGDLGARMQAALEDMFAGGSDVCCIIGSDAPDLPVAYLLDAFRVLETAQSDVILGPCRDGGYYLLGLRQVWPKLFTAISWSSADVLEQSLAAAHASGASTALLPPWQDIDTVEDLLDFQERAKGNR
jgi:rSAM/selenodomain-associated transferase 1